MNDHKNKFIYKFQLLSNMINSQGQKNFLTNS